MASPREVSEVALHANARSVRCCHNRPGGDLEPSRADTRELEAAGEALTILVVDSFTAGVADRSASLAERGLI